MMAGIEPMKAAGFYMRNGKNICFDQVVLKEADGPDVNLDDSVELIRK